MSRRIIDLSAHINETVEKGGPAAFPVTLVPLSYNLGESTEIVRDRLAVVRTDKGRALGIVSKRYVLVPHQQILDIANEATAKLDVGVVPRGIYIDRGGARMRALFKFPALASLVGRDDEICPCLKIENSYDAKSRITVHLGAFRFVCTNLAVGGGGVFAGGFMAVHSGEIPIDRVTHDLGSYLSRFASITDTYRQWQDQKLNDDKFSDFLSTVSKRMRERLRYELPEGIDTSVYRAYNAATGYATHRMRSARAAFDLLDRINRTFQEDFPPNMN